jgi:hypothetical protein
MAGYHFVSIWQISAPIEQVWEEVYHAERWPTWWSYVVGVDELEAEATGELAGTGRWTLTAADGGTLVRYNWDIRTTRRWMNLLAPVARPVFVSGAALAALGALGWRRRVSPR